MNMEKSIYSGAYLIVFLTEVFCQYWPFRGHARSHRLFTGIWSCVVPVGAGVPAKRPGLKTCKP
ncbi:hypothetical protein FY041_03905 [Pseudomonas monteilii]|nr:hypothetical protein FY041_03905 [Pseudomonas monteilii]QIG22210.1 hypothetical protein FY043_03905 [Pseudomonas monteilii]